MITINVDNSFSKITGLGPDDFKKLRKLLSYTDSPSVAYYTGGFARTKYCIDAKGNFATGLLGRAIGFCRDEALDFRQISANKIPANKVNHKHVFNFSPYQSQLDAVNAADLFDRGSMVLPTGSGKSLVMAMLIALKQVRTLVVVPNLELKRQLTVTFKQIFKDMSNITVENIDSTALKTAKNYDMLIIDESHHAAAGTYRELNKTAWNGIYYRYFMTATPFRNQDEEALLLEGIIGDIIYELTYQEAVKAKYIVPVEAYYVPVAKQKVNGHTWKQVYSELVVNNEARNDQIAVLMLRLQKAKYSTLCLVKEVAHGQKLADLTNLPFVHGQDDESRAYIEMFNKGQIPVLIGTEGVLGEGIDSKPCEFVLITGLGKAKSSFQQKVGRAVRTYGNKETAKVVIFFDPSHKWTKAHYKEQCKILLEEYCVTPALLEIE